MKLTDAEEAEFQALMKIYPHTPEQAARYVDLSHKALEWPLWVKILWVIFCGPLVLIEILYNRIRYRH